MSDPRSTPVHDHDDNSAAEIAAAEEFWQQEYVPASLLHDDCPE